MNLFGREIWQNEQQFDQLRQIQQEFERIDRQLGQRSGLWTPGFTFGGSAAGITYTVQIGNWFRQGSLVMAYGIVQMSNNGTGVGAAVLTGLPFTAKRDGAGVFVDFTQLGAAVDSLFLSVVAGAKTAAITKIAAGGTTVAAAADTDLTNTFSSRVLLMYETDED